MNQGMKTVIYPVRDLTVAKALFATLLGVDPDMDEPYYVGYTVAGQHIGLDPNGHDKGMTGPVGYWHVDDIAVAVKELTAAGAREQEAVRDVGGGRLVATLVDSDGNPIGLIQSAW
jgi:predicted enzyme related to lactoylglutathione lyase